MYPLRILTLFLIVTYCECQQCYPESGVCLDKIISQEGDVRLITLASLHHPGRGQTCGDISPGGVQSLVALKWVTRLLNGEENSNNSFIPGVRLGFDIYDDCGLSSRAVDGALELLPNSKPDDLLVCTNVTTQSPPVGVLLLSDIDATTAAADVIPPSTIVVSTNTRSPTLEDKDNFWFTESPHSEYIEGILALLERMQWYYLVVIHTDETSTRMLVNDLVPKINKGRSCAAHTELLSTEESVAALETNIEGIIDNMIQWQTQYTDEERLGVIYVGNADIITTFLQSINNEKKFEVKRFQWLILSDIKDNSKLLETIEDINFGTSSSFKTTVLTTSPYDFFGFPKFNLYFQDVLNDPGSLDNPWIQEYKAHCSTCIVPLSNDVVNTVTAISTMAVTLKLVLEEKCPNQEGVCAAARTELTKFVKEKSSVISNASLSIGGGTLKTEVAVNGNKFRIKEPIESGQYFFKFDTNTRGTGFEKIGSFDGNILQLDNTGVSASTCKQICPACVKNDIKFAYIPGDILILGLISMSDPAADKLSCGQRTNVTQRYLTMLSFLSEITNLEQIDGKTIGGLALDDCYNGFNTSHLLMELFSGRLYLYHNQQPIDMSKVRFGVGALSSGVTLLVADVLTKFHIPLVSYGASSAFLDNKRMFPYFLRTVPSDEMQAKAIVALLSELGFTQVSALYIDNSYGTIGILDVEDQATLEGICVFNKTKIYAGLNKYPDIESRLRADNIKVIVFYGIAQIATEMLDAFQNCEPAESCPSFIYVASEAWSLPANLLRRNSRGSLIFHTGTVKKIHNNFETYLRTLTLNGTRDLPMMDRFWEKAFNCNTIWSFDKPFDTSALPKPLDCEINRKLSDTEITYFANQQRVVHVSYAINAITKACKSIVGCMTKPRNEVYARTFYDKLIQTKLKTMSNEEISPFAADGNGGQGLAIYNIQKNQNAYYEYVEIGSYTSANGLQFTSDPVFYTDNDVPIPASLVPHIDCNTQLQTCATVCKTTSSPTISVTIPITPGPSTSAPSATASPQDQSATFVLIALVCILVIIIGLLAFCMFRQFKRIQDQQKPPPSVSRHYGDSTTNLYDVTQYDVPNQGVICNEVFDEPGPLSSGSSGVGSSGGSRVKYSDVCSSNQYISGGKNMSDGSHSSSSHNQSTASSGGKELDDILHFKKNTQTDYPKSAYAQQHHQRPTPSYHTRVSPHGQQLSPTREEEYRMNYLTAKDMPSPEENEDVLTPQDIASQQRFQNTNVHMNDTRMSPNTNAHMTDVQMSPAPQQMDFRIIPPETNRPTTHSSQANPLYDTRTRQSPLNTNNPQANNRYDTRTRQSPMGESIPDDDAPLPSPHTPDGGYIHASEDALDNKIHPHVSSNSRGTPTQCSNVGEDYIDPVIKNNNSSQPSISNHFSPGFRNSPSNSDRQQENQMPQRPSELQFNQVKGHHHPMNSIDRKRNQKGALSIPNIPEQHPRQHQLNSHNEQNVKPLHKRLPKVDKHPVVYSGQSPVQMESEHNNDTIDDNDGCISDQHPKEIEANYDKNSKERNVTLGLKSEGFTI